MNYSLFNKALIIIKGIYIILYFYSIVHVLIQISEVVWKCPRFN
jgi:hypothetical protein